MSWFTLQQAGNILLVHTPREDINLQSGSQTSWRWMQSFSSHSHPPALVFSPICSIKDDKCVMKKEVVATWEKEDSERDKQKTKTLHAGDKKRKRWVLWENDILNHSYTDRMTQEGSEHGSIHQYLILFHSASVDFSVEPFTTLFLGSIFSSSVS